MKILMVTDSMARGGKERRMLELIKGLCQSPGYTIKLLSLTDNLEYEYVRQLPIEFEIIKRKSRRDLSVLAKLDKVLKQFNPDIVHSWGSMASVYLSPLLWWRKKLFVNGTIADAPGRLKWYNSGLLRKRLTYPFSDVIISNSVAGIDSYWAPKKKTVCIYNGVDLHRFSNLRNKCSVQKEIFTDWNDNFFVAGMVAAFEERKDYRTLIEAAMAMVQEQEDVRFVLVGNGVDLESIRDSVPDDLKEKILFLGKRADVESIVQVFDVGILLTNARVHGEGISNSIIEYMALGKPVLATMGGGTNEIVQDGKNGYLIAPGSEEQLKNRIRQLWSDRNWANQLGMAGRSLVEAKFNLDTMTDNYKNIYQKLLSERKKA